MDTKPIFDFINEVRDRQKYVFPPKEMLQTSKYCHLQYFHDYLVILSQMEAEFEACVFQCVAENPQFKEELPIVAGKIEEILKEWRFREGKKIKGTPPYGDSKRVALQMAEKSIWFLRDNYGIDTESPFLPAKLIESSNKKNRKTASVGLSKAPSLRFNMTEAKAASLYDTLIQGSYLADTGKTEFIYYFTGVGEPPKDKLKWKSDAIILSILIKKLTPNRMPWKELSAIFDGLNIDSMRTNLSKELAKYKDEYEDSTYERHAAIVDDWLKD